MVSAMNVHKNKKKMITALLLLFLFLLLTGCSNKKAEEPQIKVVTTIFPEYDWTREIVGSENKKIDLVLLQNKGTDMHSYQPSVKDMAQISDADLLIYMGGISDSWMEEAQKNVVNEKQVSLNVMEVLKDQLKEEHHHHEKGEPEHPEEKDEHVWLSLSNAIKVCEAIEEKLVAIDPGQKELYEKNAKEYIKKLENLDQDYWAMRKAAKKDTLVFGDRFPFVYLLEDYHIHHAAAFPGCEAETGASFETIVSLAKRIDDLGLKDIMVLENSDQMVAKAINENTKDKDKNIVSLDSMQSVTDHDIAAGKTYLGIMEKNLAVLKQVLD